MSFIPIKGIRFFMQIYTSKVVNYNILKTGNYHSNPKYQPSFKAQTLPPEDEILDAIRKNKIEPAAVEQKTGKTLFFNLVENDYTTAITHLLSKPNLIKDAINRPVEGKTPLDVSQSHRMSNLLLARNAKHFSDLTEEERGQYKPLTPNPSPASEEWNSTVSKAAPEAETKEENQQVDTKQNKTQTVKKEEITEPKKEDAKVVAAKLNIGTVDVKPGKYAHLNDTKEKKEAYKIWKEIVDIHDKNQDKRYDVSSIIANANKKAEMLINGVAKGAVEEDTGMPILFSWVEKDVLGGTLAVLNRLSIEQENALLQKKYKGKTLLEYATEPTMNNHVKRLLNIKGKDANAADINLNTETADSISSKEVKNNKNRESVPSESKTKPDYFDAFEELEDEKVNETDIVKSDAKSDISVKEDYEEDISTQESKKQRRERKVFTPPESYKNYSVLTLKDGDPIDMDDIIGLENIKREISENVITPLNEQGVNVTLKANNVDIPNGILLASVADALSVVKATSSQTGMPVLQVMNLEELGPMMKDVEKNYKDTGVKTIILIQGLDKFFGEQSSALAERNFRLLMNKCGEKGALLVATTDNKDNVCKSFKKSGLLDKILEVQKPTLEDRKTYITQYFGDKFLFSDLKNDKTVSEFAELMDGFTYDDINRVLDEAARTTVSNSNDKVSTEIVQNELKEFTAERGLTPVDKNNITGQYDTEMKRIPVTEYEPKTLDDLGGMPEIKDRLRKLYIQPFRKLEMLRKELGNAAIPDGAIFYGPAGNGKTLTAKTLARELGLPYYETKLSDIATSYVHEESKAIRKLAKQLNDKYEATGEMSVWFLDEFDSLGSERNGAAQHNKEVVDTLLQEFNNPSSRGYILIAATNDISNVDSALKRRGRLGNWIPFHNPDMEERADVIRKELLKTAATKELAENKEYVEKLAKEFDGNSMSNIVSVLNDAKRMRILEDKDFNEAVSIALDLNTKREMAEFCNKAGLKPHVYSANAFNTLDELGGMDEIRQQLEENIIDIWRPEVRQTFIDNKIDLPGGVMLEGPPGTGKTTILETLARQMDIPLFKMNYSQEGNEYIHGVSRNVTDIFERLKLQSKIIKKPVMLLFDEAEKFFPRHADRHQIEEVNTYKELMNNASQNGIILVGATNHIDLVNQEIVGNPRRMGTVIHVGDPDDKGRESLFEKMRDNKPILSAVLTSAVIAELVALTDGLSIGKITDTINKLISQSIRHRKAMNGDMLLDAFKKVAR